MSFDGITTRAIVSELNEFIGSRINKINQPSYNEIILNINKNGNKKILISTSSSSPRVNITNVNYENPEKAPNFCMILRKHIQSGIIEDINQYKLDRVITFKIKTRDDFGDICYKYLIVEIMGKYSNIILLDSDGERIIDAIKRVTLDMSRVRQILPGNRYYTIKDDKINILDTNSLPYDLVDENSTDKLFQFFYKNYTGLSPTFGKELCFLAGLDQDLKVNKLNDDEIKKIDKTFLYLKEKIVNNDFNPRLYLSPSRDKLVEFYPFELTHLGKEFIENDSMSYVIDEYYKNTKQSDRINNQVLRLNKAITNLIHKNNNKLQIQMEELEKAKDREKYRLFADLIAANYHLNIKGEKKISLVNFYDPELNKIEVPLDEKKSMVQNAQNYYKKYSKLKNTENILNKELPKLRSEISYLKQILATLDTVTENLEIDEIKEELDEAGFNFSRKKTNKAKKKKIKSSPLHLVTSSGLDVYVGKNNKQNDELTLKFANKGDIFFHVKTSPGSHVILRTSHEASKKDLEEAAYLAAKYSSLSSEKLVDVDYTEKKNVYKQKGAKPGMVYYTDFSTITVDLTKEDWTLKI